MNENTNEKHDVRGGSMHRRSHAMDHGVNQEHVLLQNGFGRKDKTVRYQEG
jgi:hypothetical protein